MRRFFGRRNISFSVLLPTLSVAFWTVLVAVPSALFLLQSRSVDSFESRPIQIGGGTVFLPPLTPLSFALLGVTSFLHRFIVVLNAPAVLLEILIAFIFNHGDLNIGSMGIVGWESLTYPFLSIPAWIFVARGLDALAGRVSLRVGDLLCSLTLAAISMIICAGLTFGASVADR